MSVRVDINGSLATIALHRPDVRNAFNDALIATLTDAFVRLPSSVRVVVLAGDGAMFSAGADLTWMKSSSQLSEQENITGARKLAELFSVIDQAPCAVIGRVQGAALGGGVGLVACCDMVVAESKALFGFTEVRLGLAPAVISPFVLRKIGASAARRYFLTGETFDAYTALQLGLVHRVVEAEELDAAVEVLVKQMNKSGPMAVKAAKKLIEHVTASPHDIDYTIRTIAQLRTSPEGQEGLAAFLEKRAPPWA